MSEDIRSKIIELIEQYNRAKANVPIALLLATPMWALYYVDKILGLDALCEQLRALCLHPTVKAEFAELEARLGRERESWMSARSVCITKDRKNSDGKPEPITNSRPYSQTFIMGWSTTPELVALNDAKKELEEAGVNRPLELPRPTESYTLRDFIDEFTWQRKQLEAAASGYARLSHPLKGLTDEQQRKHEIRKQKCIDECRAMQGVVASDALVRRMAGTIKNSEPKLTSTLTILMNDAIDLIREAGRDFFTLTVNFSELNTRFHRMDDFVGKLAPFIDAAVNAPTWSKIQIEGDGSADHHIYYDGVRYRCKGRKAIRLLQKLIDAKGHVIHGDDLKEVVRTGNSKGDHLGNIILTLPEPIQDLIVRPGSGGTGYSIKP